MYDIPKSGDVIKHLQYVKNNKHVEYMDKKYKIGWIYEFKKYDYSKFYMFTGKGFYQLKFTEILISTYYNYSTNKFEYTRELHYDLEQKINNSITNRLIICRAFVVKLDSESLCFKGFSPSGDLPSWPPRTYIRPTSRNLKAIRKKTFRTLYTFLNINHYCVEVPWLPVELIEIIFSYL
jgi:hypothetical protein